MNNIPAGKNGRTLSLSDLGQGLDDRLINKTIGYAYVISYKDKFGYASSGGQCRTSLDDPERTMTVFEKYDVASVSKAISGTALTQLLYHSQEQHLGSPMWRYLPSHWKMGPGVKDITFHELLTHQSGFKAHGPRTYASLKQVVEEGIQPNDKAYFYASTNFALMRLIIPKLAGYDILSLRNVPSFALPANEPTQARQFAEAYIDYCRKNVFEKAGLFEMDCKNDSPAPPLFYDFNDLSKKGEVLADQTLSAGSRGWVMDTTQLADLFRTIHYTSKILPLSISKRMRDEWLGFDQDADPNDPNLGELPNRYKTGWYPVNGCTYNSLIILFENEVSVAIMTNSHSGLKHIAWAAFNDWYH